MILSPGMAEALDRQSGVSGAHSGRHQPTPRSDQATNMHTGSNTYYADEGGASRFFLQAGYEPWELEWILTNGLRPCGER